MSNSPPAPSDPALAVGVLDRIKGSDPLFCNLR
jgi:hypothetical protein